MRKQTEERKETIYLEVAMHHLHKAFKYTITHQLGKVKHLAPSYRYWHQHPLTSWKILYEKGKG
jgi:hypothetical protein